MRKTILSFLCLCAVGVSWATPWGVLHDYQEIQEEAKAGQEDYPYLIDVILQGGSVRVYLEGPEDMTDKERAQYEQEVNEGYQRWFSHTAKTIRQKNRTEEFADILPLLEEGIPVKFVNDKQDANINFKFVPRMVMKTECGSRTAAACYTRRYQPMPTIFLVEKTFSLRNMLSTTGRSRISTATHEIGHSLGLSDQYSINGGRNNSDIRYSTPENQASLMNRSDQLKCDDADGMVNLIDLSRKKFRGGLDGWKGFCKKSPVYVQGMVASKGPYFIGNLDKRYMTVDVVRNGVEEERLVFDDSITDDYSPLASRSHWNVTERDAQGRVVRTAGPNGEEAFFSYGYDLKWELVVKDGKFLLEEQTLRRKKGGRHLVTYAVGGGKYHRMNVWSLGHGAKLVYLNTGIGKKEGEKSYSVEMQISGKGKVDWTHWYGDYPGKEEEPGWKSDKEVKKIIAEMKAQSPGYSLKQEVNNSLTRAHAQEEQKRILKQMIEFASRPM